MKRKKTLTVKVGEYYEGGYEIIKIIGVDPIRIRIIKFKKEMETIYTGRLFQEGTYNYLLEGIQRGKWIKIPQIKAVMLYEASTREV